MLTQLDNGAYFSPLGDPLRYALNSQCLGRGQHILTRLAGFFGSGDPALQLSPTLEK